MHLNSRLGGLPLLTLLLCILCSVTVAPVMASQHRETVVEDGVHLVKFDDSPTILDSRYYHIEQNMDFVIDGNQFYWVRVGKVVAKELTSVWWSRPLAGIGLLSILIIVACVGIPRSCPNVPLRLIVVIFFIMGMILNIYCTDIVTNRINQAVCGEYRDLQASDGTILFKVDKLHPENNGLLMKSGINLSQLYHMLNEVPSI